MIRCVTYPSIGASRGARGIPKKPNKGVAVLVYKRERVYHREFQFPG